MKRTLLKPMLLLCALIVGSGSVWAAEKWVKTTPAELTTGDVVVIVDQTTAKALPNTAVTKAPAATAIELNAAKSEITSTVTETLQWTVTVADGTYQFSTVSGGNTLYLACKSDNNGVYVSSTVAASDSKTFSIVTDTGNNNADFLKTVVIKKNTSDTEDRYLGCYNSSDWRCYTTINNNIKNTVTAFYKKTTVSGAVDPTIAISSESIAVDGTATISGPDGLSITFDSSDEDVAIVDEDGVVTGKAAGSATITATWGAVADAYNAGSKQFTVTVFEATTYEKVTSMNQLVAGNQYILVATEYNKAMGAQGSNIRSSVDVTISDDKVAILNEEVAVLTLGGSKDAWTFLTSDNSEYLAYSGSSNQVHSNNDPTSDAAKWKVTANFELESANVSGRVLKYNSAQPRFACYANGQQTAVLFVKAGSAVSATININAACTDGEGKYYGTYSNGSAFVVPADLTVSTIKVADGKLAITNYSTGDVVKANTGVMVSSTTAGDHTVVLSNETGTEKDGNMLKASGDAGIDATAMTAASDSNTKFYRLTMHNGTTIGFWWGAAEGTAFALGANKAYLAVPADAQVSGFSFDEDMATGISSNLRETAADGRYYTMQGVEVAQPTKGLYIVNGKKVILK